MTLSDSQFGEMVKRRHAANTPFNADEIEGMTDDQYNVVLNDVAHMQRGRPERAMDHAQQVFGGGLYSHSLEHIGDLTHRMNEPYATRGRYNPEYVIPKVHSQLGYLTSRYGYDREVAEQQAGNSRYRESQGQPVSTEDDLYNARRDYTLGHHQLPVYNEVGYHAKAAAVHIGLQNSSKAAEHLSSLKAMTGDADRYQQAMSREGAVSWLRSQEPR
jgi:hypothetical protein